MGIGELLLHSRKLLQRLFPSSLLLSNNSLVSKQLLVIEQVNIVDLKDGSSQTSLSWADEVIVEVLVLILILSCHILHMDVSSIARSGRLVLKGIGGPAGNGLLLQETQLRGKGLFGNVTVQGIQIVLFRLFRLMP